MINFHIKANVHTVKNSKMNTKQFRYNIFSMSSMSHAVKSMYADRERREQFLCSRWKCNISEKHNKWMMTGKSTFYEIYFNVMLTFHLLSRIADGVWYGRDKNGMPCPTPAYNSACLMKINEWPKCWDSRIFICRRSALKILSICAVRSHNDNKNNLWRFFPTYFAFKMSNALRFFYINIHTQKTCEKNRHAIEFRIQIERTEVSNSDKDRNHHALSLLLQFQLAWKKRLHKFSCCCFSSYPDVNYGIR